MCLWNRNRLRKRYFWPVRVGVRHTGISLGYLLNEAVVFKVILYDFVRWVEEGYYILRLLVFAGIISVSRNQSKRAVRRPKKAERPCFDVDDLVNILDSLWTDDDSIFIHVVMRTQITFLLQAHCFSGARIGAFLHNSTAEVKGKDGQIDRLVFEGLTWKAVHVYLFPLRDGSTEVITKIVQRWTKNSKDPENSVLEVPAYEHGKLRLDITAFLLALAFRDDVFIGISSLTDLWNFRVPEGEPTARVTDTTGDI